MLSILRSRMVTNSIRICKPIVPAMAQTRSYIYITPPPRGWQSLRGDMDEIDDSNVKRINTDNFREHSMDDYPDDESDGEDFYEISMPGGREIMEFMAEEKDNSLQYTASEANDMINYVADFHASEEFYGHRMEHEKRKDKRRRIANQVKGRMASQKVHALVDLINIKRAYRPKKAIRADSSTDTNDYDSDPFDIPDRVTFDRKKRAGGKK